MSYLQKMIDKVDRWKSSLENYIKAELGKIPEFDYSKQKYDILGGTPWRIKYKNKKPTFAVYNYHFDDWFFDYLKSERSDLKEFGLGRLVFCLVHDIIHLYQIGPLMEKRGFIKNWIYRAYTHFDWVEGLAQLYTFKICNNMYKEAKPEDFSLLDNNTVEKFVSNSLEPKQYKRSIANILAYFLSKDTNQLRGAGEIGEDEFSFSKYPFKIDKDITDIVEKKLSQDESLREKLLSKKKVKNNPYLWGAYEISVIASKGIYTMDTLIKNPLSNKELEKAVKLASL